MNKLTSMIERLKEVQYALAGRIRQKYYKYAFAKCGKSLKINGKPLIFKPNRVYVGDHCTINNGVQLAPRGKIVLGNYVTLSRGSQITAGTLDTNTWCQERYKEHKHIQEDCYLADGTWLCVNSIILPGVHINGKGVIVAAGAVVTHDINDDYVIVAGIPAKVVKKLE